MRGEDSYSPSRKHQIKTVFFLLESSIWNWYWAKCICSPGPGCGSCSGTASSLRETITPCRCSYHLDLPISCSPSCNGTSSALIVSSARIHSTPVSQILFSAMPPMLLYIFVQMSLLFRHLSNWNVLTLIVTTRVRQHIIPGTCPSLW